MEIYNVPPKGNLLYLNAQYFNNERSRGVAEHVIKIQYKAKRGEKEQAFVMPLSTLVKEINRKARGKLTAEDAAAVNEMCAELKAQQKTFGFGFRQVTVTEKKGGARLFHRQQDCNVSCWVLFEQEHVRVELLWRGEVISIQIRGHKTGSNPGQSLGIGYWDRGRDPELANRLAALAVNSAARVAGAAQKPAELASSAEAEERANSDEEPEEQVPTHRGCRTRVDRKPARRERRRADAETSLDWGAWQPELVPDFGEGLGVSIALRR